MILNRLFWICLRSSSDVPKNKENAVVCQYKIRNNSKDNYLYVNNKAITTVRLKTNNDMCKIVEVKITIDLITSILRSDKIDSSSFQNHINWIFQLHNKSIINSNSITYCSVGHKISHWNAVMKTKFYTYTLSRFWHSSIQI